IFQAFNGAMQTTAALVKVTTGNTIKTLLQIAPPANTDILIVEWGISFDAFADAAHGTVELIETDVAATVTAWVANDITKYSDADANASLITLGTAASGFTAS